MVNILLASVGWVVEGFSEMVRGSVPFFLVSNFFDLPNASSADSLNVRLNVLHVSLSVDSSIAVLSVVVSDLSLEPGVVLP